MTLNSNNSIDNSIDFDVDINTSNLYKFEIREYFFKKEWNLIWYIKVHFLEPEKSDNIARVIDTTSSSGYEYMTSSMKDIYNSNWYNPSFVIKWVANQFLEYVLRDIKDIYWWEDCMVLLSSYDSWEKYLSNTIDNVKKQTNDLIKAQFWWSDFCSFTLKI